MNGKKRTGLTFEQTQERENKMNQYQKLQC